MMLENPQLDLDTPHAEAAKDGAISGLVTPFYGGDKPHVSKQNILQILSETQKRLLMPHTQPIQ